MKLFSLDEATYKVVVSEEALLLSPFKKIWDRDKTKGKAKALNELAFIYFTEDIKSDFNNYTNPEEKKAAILQNLSLPKTWKPDKVIDEALKFYGSSSETVSSKLLKDSLFIADELSTKLKEQIGTLDDIGEFDKVANILKKLPSIIKELFETEKMVLKELRESSNKLGSKEKAMFEDGI